MAVGGRTLILCFDGTTNEFSTENTNVIKFFQLLKKDDPENQLVYYQPGVGTYENPGILMPFYLAMSKLLDQAFAWYLDAHIMGGYSFLMQNYRKGDRICLFGFSRGAYTARCLAGMLHKVGLLPISNKEQISFAYTNYANSTKQGWKQSKAFKQTFSMSVDIEFVGCWETVSSVGVIVSRHLPFSTANTIIRTFRHALALDEHRVRFQPNLWHKEPEDEDATIGARKIDPENATPPQCDDDDIETGCKGGIGAEIRDASITGGGRTKTKTDVKEVWFTGCHSDVGGGSVPNDTPHSLAFIPFRWMVEQTILCQAGILYLPGALHSIGLTTDPFIEARANASRDSVKPNRIERYLNGDKGKGKETSGANGVDEPPIVGEDGQIEIADDTTTARNREVGEKLDEIEMKKREEEHLKRDEEKVQDDGEDDTSTSPNGALPLPSSNPSDAGPCQPTQGPSTNDAAPQLTITHHDDDNSSEVADGAPLEPPRNVEGETDAQRHAHDLKSKIYDPLKITPIWWVLEILPMYQKYMDAKGKWHRTFRSNFGRPRTIWSPEEPYLHVAVKERMEAGIGYKPRARLVKGLDKARWTQ
ncbi:hypothetical protein FRB94_001978 [Tulasnella sp. JGI-2019a]|nr:hypothetical protein FRB94_001978 [Tulasnella sp. JGI-2019a]